MLATESSSSGERPSARETNATNRPLDESVRKPAKELLTAVLGSAPRPVGRLRRSVAGASAAGAVAGASAARALTATMSIGKRFLTSPRYACERGMSKRYLGRGGRVLR